MLITNPIVKHWMMFGIGCLLLSWASLMPTAWAGWLEYDQYTEPPCTLSIEYFNTTTMDRYAVEDDYQDMGMRRSQTRSRHCYWACYRRIKRLVKKVPDGYNADFYCSYEARSILVKKSHPPEE